MQLPAMFLRSMREFVGSFLRISIDPTTDAEYIKATKWHKEEAVPASTELRLEKAKEAYEFGQAQFAALVAAYERADDQAVAALKHNAYLIAGVFAFFRSQAEPIPWFVRIAMACWLVAMLLLSIMTRRLWRPIPPQISDVQGFADCDDPRFHAWMNRNMHPPMVLLRIIMNNEARIFNFALAFTIAGLVLLIVAVMFS